ncbi:MAG: hypothetical protein HYU36_03050 [Planctomycetes bacterium]|nr:hypothetical protein [Planctomycetota bacterium]
MAGRPTVYCHADERESTLREWKPASAWWGGGLDRSPLEIDVASESVGGSALLLGEVEWAERSDPQRLALELSGKSEKFPLSRGRNVYLSLWIKKRGSRQVREAVVQGPAEVLPVL